MKKIFAIVLVVVLMATLIPGVALADKPANKGNGLPKDAGKSFNFNVIGVPNQKNWDPDSYNTGGNGKRIFIKRTGTTQVFVHGDNVTNSIAILDHDGTDGKVGISRTEPGILLPYVGAEPEGYWDCQVYVRLLGPANDPDNNLHWKTSGWNGTDYALLTEFTLERDEYNKFTIKNSDILDDEYQDILWEWDPGRRFKIMQVRIFMGAPPD